MTRVLNLEIGFRIQTQSVIPEKDFNKVDFLRKLGNFHENIKLYVGYLAVPDKPVRLENIDFRRTKVAGYIKTEFIYDFHVLENLTAPSSISNAEVGVMRINNYMCEFSKLQKVLKESICWKFTPIRVQEVL